MRGRSIITAALAVFILSPSVRCSEQSQNTESKDLHSESRFVDQSEQLRQLWSSTIKQSDQLQTLIKAKYPNLSARDEENMLDVIDDFDVPELSWRRLFRPQNLKVKVEIRYQLFMN